MYGCQSVKKRTSVNLCFVNIAKLELSFSEFTCLCSSRLALAAQKMSVKFGRYMCSSRSLTTWPTLRRSSSVLLLICWLFLLVWDNFQAPCFSSFYHISSFSWARCYVKGTSFLYMSAISLRL